MVERIFFRDVFNVRLKKEIEWKENVSLRIFSYKNITQHLKYIIFIWDHSKVMFIIMFIIRSCKEMHSINTN